MPVEFLIKLVKVSGSVRMTVPIEIVRALSLKPGDTVSVVLTDHEIMVKKKEG